MRAWAFLRGALFCLLDRRWIRFCLVGGAATVVYAALGLFLVNLLRWPVLAGNALAYILSFFVSYLGQSRWTFQARGRNASMLPRFAATQGLGLGLNSFLVWLLVGLGLPYELAMLLAVALVPFFVYFVCKIWVFRQKKPAGKGA